MICTDLPPTALDAFTVKLDTTYIPQFYGTFSWMLSIIVFQNHSVLLTLFLWRRERGRYFSGYSNSGVVGIEEQ